MVSRMQKRMVLNKQLHILKTLTSSKSVKKSSIIMDTILHICELRLKIEAIQREYLINLKQEVKVEKVGDGFLVRIMCEKGEDVLVSILECFHEMGLNVLQAKVACTTYFAMEAIVESHHDQALEVRVITQAVVKAISKQNMERTPRI